MAKDIKITATNAAALQTALREHFARTIDEQAAAIATLIESRGFNEVEAELIAISQALDGEPTLGMVIQSITKSFGTLRDFTQKLAAARAAQG